MFPSHDPTVVLSYWLLNSTDYTLSANTECILPDVIYGTGLTLNCYQDCNGDEVSACTYSLALVDDYTVICGTYMGNATSSGPFYVQGVSDSFGDCQTCLRDNCPEQDFVVLIDQSSSISSSEYSLIKQGVVTMATNWQAKMGNNELRMGAIRWSSCGSVTQISDLTFDYCNFVDDVNNAGKAGGGTFVSEALVDAYNMLTSSESGFDKNIILITDGGISDFNGTTLPNCLGTAATTLANQMKSGTYGSGVPIKIYTVNIQSGINAQLESLSSGPCFHFFASSFGDFANNVASQIASDPCQENPLTGTSYNYYMASPCCTDLNLDDIVIALETGVTPSYSVDTFMWNGPCYTIESITANTFSGSSVYTVDPSEFTTCSDPPIVTGKHKCNRV